MALLPLLLVWLLIKAVFTCYTLTFTCLNGIFTSLEMIVRVVDPGDTDI